MHEDIVLIVHVVGFVFRMNHIPTYTYTCNLSLLCSYECCVNSF